MSDLKIIQIHSGFVSPVLIANGENSILVDTGRKGFGNEILKAIISKGLKPANIKLIILTHTHFDHAGNARFLKEKTGAKIIVHKNEAKCLEKGYTIIPRGTIPFSKRMSWLGRNLFPFIGKYPSVKPDIIVENELDLADWGIDGKILHTPGHTKGSQSVLIGNSLLAGDAFFNRGLKGVFPPFADEPELLIKTWEKIFKLNINKIYPGHGAAFKIDRAIETYDDIKSKYLQN
ncbi:MAG: MBL fold metallo-hydrolase [Prolixibacteraceae bacterium]|nr:MBL fold metallo-hydrolase [Prolixibacteraceae bacterium]MBN2775873.1 MBL fold metallo-hydrolase [Prolixibacteraceae bacterium]